MSDDEYSADFEGDLDEDEYEDDFDEEDTRPSSRLQRMPRSPVPTNIVDESVARPGLCFVEDGGAVQYGLEQHDGGPCGVIAAVQAVVLDELVYGGSARPWDAKARSKAVAAALVTVLWRAAAAAAEERGGPPVATLCVLSREPCAADAAAALRPDGVTDRLSLRSCASPEELERLVASQAVQRLYEARHARRCAALLSAVLSRTVAGARGDGDDGDRCFIDGRGFANFEVINLLLFGRANTFDGVRDVDGVVLARRGATAWAARGRRGAGLLRRGRLLKSPRVPIFIVYSESHFSVLFSDDPAVLDRDADRPFDLTYWDCLSTEDGPVRLTVDPCLYDASGKSHRPCRPRSTTTPLIPPLDVVVRTRWPNAGIDWNDSEPIL
ncbi:ubiquitinyl hydrolase [Aureococcus anophagefferens]|nr:ubiquitinyl hydrolase [Aureococcus anophagefferens]